MDPSRAEGLERLNSSQVELHDPSYLHYRTFFADLHQASVHARGRLLDIGCGNKPYKAMFGSKVSEYVGCDVVQSSSNSVDIICPATAIPLPDHSFDTILCTQVIEHVAEHQLLIQEAFRLLRSPGVLILSGPLYWPLHEEPYDFFRFTEYGLRFLLEGVGFGPLIIKRNGGQWALSGQALIHALSESRLNRRVVIRTINWLFGYLDTKRTYGTPINYVVTAFKP